MVRLTRLRIDRFRNVKPGTDLRFGPTFNVLLGKNATGKSTLLDLIAAVTNDDLSTYAGEDAGFDLTWWLEKGDESVEVQAVRTPARSVALLDEAREGNEFDDVWTAVIRTAGTDLGRLEVTGMRGTWKPQGEPDESFEVSVGLTGPGARLRGILALLVKYMWVNNQPVALAKTPQMQALPVAQRVLAHGNSGRFDEATSTFESITRSRLVLSGRVPRGGQIIDPRLPSELFMGAPISSEPLVFRFEDLQSLSEIPALIGFLSAELRPRLFRQVQTGETGMTEYQGFDFLFRRTDGSTISHDLLSFGQKRLFAFLWYLAVRRELPIVADELLNGLHHEWIEACFNRLRDRQSFLATQHPFLLDHIPIENAESVSTTFVRCAIERDEGGHECLVWRNFDEEEAERFFIAYQTGIQQVSEVLRTEGLW